LQGFREALNEAQAIACGRLRQSQPVLSARQTAHLCVALASMPLDQRPKPISTGIPSLDLDMRGGVIAGKGEGTWVLAARSGIGKTTVAVAAAMGLAFNGPRVQERCHPFHSYTRGPQPLDQPLHPRPLAAAEVAAAWPSLGQEEPGGAPQGSRALL
jgi:hypothetical protein